MDLSGLIFVALAIAWAAYLIPKAMRHHDDVVRGRSVDRFSQRMRVLARREPVSARVARLVVPPARAAASAVMNTGPSGEPSTPDERYDARRASTRKATRRRRRVLTLLLVALVAVVAACAIGRLAWVYVAIPTVLLVAWLVACRLMVRRERAVRPFSVHAAGRAAGHAGPEELLGDADQVKPQVSDSQPAEGARDPELWDPVPMTLPTYVSKPPARRSVRTIDLDSTGVWTSGRTEADAALAREAEAADRVRRRVDRKRDQGEEAVGS